MVPSNEYGDRVKRAKQLMEVEKHDLLVIYSDAWRISNVCYFTGFRSYDGIVPIYISLLLLPLSEEPILFVYFTLVPTAHRESQVANIRPLEEFSVCLRNLARKHQLKRVGIIGETIFPLSIHEIAKSALEGITLESSDIVARLKAVKSENEINLMRKAAKLTDEGLKAVAAAMGEGISEYELVAEANYAMSSKGPGGPCIDNMVQSGPNSEVLLKRPTERRIQRGDMVLIDLAARCRMYSSDVARGIVFSGTKEQKKIMEVAVLAFEEGLRSVRSGVRACDLYTSVQGVIKEAGYGEYFKESAGHGIGMDPEEEIPFITPENEMTVEAGMTFALKSAIMVPGQGGIRIEDVVVAREKEAELLTAFDHRLLLD